ncbi:MAG: hypothetical protein NW226_26830 [Microscillaceae bacterium]|nr:hypothetical protein [Microscillaceae bacterium]
MPAISGWGSMNGKPIFITGFYSLLCTCLIIAIIYVYTQDKIFSKYVGIFYGFLYVIGGVLFVIEKFVSKTLLPDKLNIYVETLIAYPFLLLCFAAAYQLYNTQRLA